MAVTSTGNKLLYAAVNVQTCHQLPQNHEPEKEICPNFVLIMYIFVHPKLIFVHVAVKSY